LSGLVNGVLAGTGAFQDLQPLWLWTASCNRGVFLTALRQTKRSYSHLGMVSAAFGIRGEDSRTRASPAKELKFSIRSDVPALDPDRTGTGGFVSPHQPVPGAGFVQTIIV
jgi:hypothetical protein